MAKNSVATQDCQSHSMVPPELQSHHAVNPRSREFLGENLSKSKKRIRRKIPQT